jgi:sortase A
MRRWMGRLERLLLAFGALTLGIYTIARIDGFIHSRAEVERFKSQRVFAQEANRKAEGTGKRPDFSLWSAIRIQGYQASLAAHFAPAEALLRIPKIHLEVPVLEGTDDVSLNRAVGHIAGTATPGSDGNGNIGIAGHRDGFFRALKDVAMGDTIEIEAPNETRTYVIDRITIVDPSDVSVLSQRTRPSVTLVTCYPFYFVGSAPQRYIVQASLKKSAGKSSGPSDDAEF